MPDSSEPRPLGQICWLEVPVSSPSRAAAFYNAVLGWTCPSPDKGTPSPITGADNVVYMFSHGELSGAFVAVPESCHAKAWDDENKGKMAVLTTFLVGSIDQTLAKVKENGGREHLPKTAIGSDMGFFARFIDSEGNLQGIWAQK